MEILQIIITSVVSLLVLFILTKLGGNKQISELTIFDYIIGISIGSIAAEMATELENPLYPLSAMIVYGIASIVFSLLSSKSLKIRRIIFGKTVVLFENGVLYRKNFKKSRIDLSEFLMQCRLNGYYDINELKMAALEPNGKISFLPKAEYKPATPNDLKTPVKQQNIPISVILDGKIVEGNILNSEKDIKWIYNELKTLGIKSADEVFLATLCENTLNVFKNTPDCPQNDMFNS